MPYIQRNEAGKIVLLHGALDPMFHEARNYLASGKLQDRMGEYVHVHMEAARLRMSFDDAVTDICARWPEWLSDAELDDLSGPAPSGVFDSEDADAPEMEHPKADFVQAEESGEVHLQEGPDGQEQALGSLSDEGAEGGLSGDPSMVYPGMLVMGDLLKTAQMEKTWRVGELEAAKLDEYDIDANASRLAELRSYSLAAKEGAAPDLTFEQNEELQAMEGFAAWLGVIRNHADSLRNLIRLAPDLDTLGLIEIESGWPD